MKSAFTAAILVSLSAVAFAQPPGVRNDLVGTTLPLEGAPKAIPGPYKVVKEPAFGSAGHVAFRPEDLSAFPRKDKLPVMAWGDGGCAINSARCAGVGLCGLRGLTQVPRVEVIHAVAPCWVPAIR